MKKKLFSSFVMVLCSVLFLSSVGPVYAQASKKPNVSNSTVHTTMNNNYPLTQNQRGLPSPGDVQETTGIKTKAISFALRHGGIALGNLIKKIPYKWANKVGDSIAKYGNKAANVIDNVTDFGETSVTLALVQAGIPPADAALIAKFIVFFLG